MSPNNQETLAAVRFHPALIIISFLVVGSFLTNIWPLSASLDNQQLFGQLGLGLFGMAILILTFAYGSMARAKTTINPSEHSTSVVSTGIYAYTRNPIYIGWFIIFVAIALRNNSWFDLVLSTLMIALLHWAAVLPEEAYLERKFGEEYSSYKERVRRWL